MNLRTPLIVAAGLVSSGAFAAPLVNELGWVLEREIVFNAPMSALMNPADGLIYAGQRPQDIYVFDADGVSTKVEDTDNVAGLEVDPRNGDLYMSEDFPGHVKRIAFGTTLATIWVTAFDSGDDDPVGLCFVPEDYTGSVFTAGGMALTDRGFGSADEIWSFDTAMTEGAVEVFQSVDELTDPVDIAVRSDGLIVIADNTNGLRVLGDDGIVTPLVTTPVLTGAHAVAFDGRSDDLFVLDVELDSVLRVDLDTGLATEIITGFALVDENWGGLNIDNGPETQRMVVSSRNEDRIWVFASVPGCNNADLSIPFGVLDLSDINLFVNAFTGLNPIADFDDNGIFDLADVLEYIGAFTGGCP